MKTFRFTALALTLIGFAMGGHATVITPTTTTPLTGANVEVTQIANTANDNGAFNTNAIKVINESLSDSYSVASSSFTNGNVIIGVRDRVNDYASGTLAGFVIEANGSLNNGLTPALLSKLKLTFFQDGVAVKNIGSLEGLDLGDDLGGGISLKGAPQLSLTSTFPFDMVQYLGGNKVRVAANAPATFDEVRLSIDGLVAASVLNSMSVYYAFVGEDAPVAINTANYMNAYLMSPTTLTIPGQAIESTLVSGAAGTLTSYSMLSTLLSDDERFEIAVNASKTIQANADKPVEVGFVVSKRDLLDLILTGDFEIAIYDKDGNQLGSKKINGKIGLSKAQNGSSTISMVVNIPFAAVGLRFPQDTGASLGSGGVYYAYYRDINDYHSADINFPTTIVGNSTTGTYDFKADPNLRVTFNEEGISGKYRLTDHSYHFSGFENGKEYTGTVTRLLDGATKSFTFMNAPQDNYMLLNCRPLSGSGYSVYYTEDDENFDEADLYAGVGGKNLGALVDNDINDCVNLSIFPKVKTYGKVVVGNDRYIIHALELNPLRAGFVIERENDFHSIVDDNVIITTYLNDEVIEENIVDMCSSKNEYVYTPDGVKILASIGAVFTKPFNRIGISCGNERAKNLRYAFTQQVYEAPTTIEYVPSHILSSFSNASIDGALTRLTSGYAGNGGVIGDIDDIFDGDIDTGVEINLSEVEGSDTIAISFNLGDMVATRGILGVALPGFGVRAGENIDLRTLRNGVVVEAPQSVKFLRNVVSDTTPTIVYIPVTESFDGVTMLMSGISTSATSLDLAEVFFMPDTDGDGYADNVDFDPSNGGQLKSHSEKFMHSSEFNGVTSTRCNEYTNTIDVLYNEEFNRLRYTQLINNFTPWMELVMYENDWRDADGEEAEGIVVATIVPVLGQHSSYAAKLSFTIDDVADGHNVTFKEGTQQSFIAYHASGNDGYVTPHDESHVAGYNSLMTLVDNFSVPVAGNTHPDKYYYRLRLIYEDSEGDHEISSDFREYSVPKGTMSVSTNFYTELQVAGDNSRHAVAPTKSVITMSQPQNAGTYSMSIDTEDETLASFDPFRFVAIGGEEDTTTLDENGNLIAEVEGGSSHVTGTFSSLGGFTSEGFLSNTYGVDGQDLEPLPTFTTDVPWHNIYSDHLGALKHFEVEIPNGYTLSHINIWRKVTVEKGTGTAGIGSLDDEGYELVYSSATGNKIGEASMIESGVETTEDGKVIYLTHVDDLAVSSSRIDLAVEYITRVYCYKETSTNNGSVPRLGKSLEGDSGLDLNLGGEKPSLDIDTPVLVTKQYAVMERTSSTTYSGTTNLDNVCVEPEAILAYSPAAGTIAVNSVRTVNVYDTLGRLVATVDGEGTIDNIATGNYIVTDGTTNLKLRVK